MKSPGFEFLDAPKVLDFVGVRCRRMKGRSKHCPSGYRKSDDCGAFHGIPSGSPSSPSSPSSLDDAGGELGARVRAPESSAHGSFAGETKSSAGDEKFSSRHLHQLTHNRSHCSDLRLGCAQSGHYIAVVGVVGTSFGVVGTGYHRCSPTPSVA